MPKKRTNVRFRRWTWTINLAKVDDFEADNVDPERMAWAPPLDPAHVLLRYLICKLEVGESDTVHWQGYSELKDKVSMKKVKEVLACPWMHLEPSNGNAEDNQEYVSKEASSLGFEVIEWGKPSTDSQGARNDLLAVKDSIDAGRSIEEIVDLHFGEYVKYHHGIEKAMAKLKAGARPPTRDVKSYLLWGPTGTGKTHGAIAKAEELGLHYYIKSFDTAEVKWWDQYNGEEVLILDEFEGQIPLHHLKRLLDKYPVECSRRGSKFLLCANSS